MITFINHLFLSSIRKESKMAISRKKRSNKRLRILSRRKKRKLKK